MTLIPRSILNRQPDPIAWSARDRGWTTDDVQRLDANLAERLRDLAIRQQAEAGLQPYAWKLRLLGDPRARLYIDGERCVTTYPSGRVRHGADSIRVLHGEDRRDRAYEYTIGAPR